ncbi:SoxR reducing system RseC family protein [Ferrimonas aestuarii]|uniref:Fis family transcriptional regulator n=1 Tax=Ferrimonas aestuarii TaxID=2569539 RepID=A0A4U1BN23_9GAMM|nr:SoxR reducing system RseC family protein [Ferrimonas aestuarii]TKB55307.1 Fis family transcriptional regulator [Ferrimonas aestuarii]
MITALGRVEAWQDGWVTVSWRAQSACGHCEQSESCGTSAVAKAVEVKRQQLILPYETPLVPGAQVHLSIPEQQLVTAAALVYLLPLLGLLLGVGLGSVVGLAELLTLLLGLTVGSLGFWVARTLAPRLTPVPKVTQVLSTSAQEKNSEFQP